MKKRIIVWSFSFLSILSFNSTVTMHGKVLMGVKGLTSGSLIAVGALSAYVVNEKRKKPVKGIPMPSKVQKWVRTELEKLDVPNSNKIPLLLDKEDSWRVEWGKAIRCSLEDAGMLLEAFESPDCQESQEAIALSSIILKHEVWHLLNKDCQKRICSLVAIPTIVQAGCSAVTYGFNKIFKIKPPKTVVRTLGRSLVAVAAMAPKYILSEKTATFYRREQESAADRFACEHAASRLELEEFCEVHYKDYKEMESFLMKYEAFAALDIVERDMRMRSLQINDDHPYCIDRAAMGLYYLKKWDEEHKS
jgi:hypothetical protein